jgi:hypothetical protein
MLWILVGVPVCSVDRSGEISPKLDVRLYADGNARKMYDASLIQDLPGKNRKGSME